MPKRRHEEKIDRYKYKIRRLEEKERKRRQRIIESSDSFDEISENELLTVHGNIPSEEGMQEQSVEIVPDLVETTPDLDPDILLALGETIEETNKFGEKIHENLARLWQPILRKGLEKETKESLMKNYQIPESCTLLQAPKLNPEIAATISDITRAKDKRVESAQQQLGVAITALNKGLSLLIENDIDKVKIIKYLSDSSRILCDLHNVETEVRKKFMTPGLDKSFLNLIQDENRDETLFGHQLSEKIKVSRTIEKHGLQIKKAPPGKTVAAPSTPGHNNRLRSQVNWSHPPRYPSNRGGRAGYRRIGTGVPRGPQPSTSKQPSLPQQSQAKPRVQAQQR